MLISYLRGIIQDKQLKDQTSDKLVLEMGGIGFEITCSRRTLLELGDIGDEAVVHTHLAIRENDWTIFGFANQDEAEMFNLLQTVSGVGPKSALALVGTLGPITLAEAISKGDHKLLSQAPGIGNKSAQRLILELKSKIEDWQAVRGTSADATTSGASLTEVKSILQGLGYTPTEINSALKQVHTDNPESLDVELIVRNCLKLLGAAKL
jgi:Holliday junction DNA helicase RuvA